MPRLDEARFGPRNNQAPRGVIAPVRRLVGALGLLLFVAAGVVGGMRVWSMAGSTYDAMTFPAHIATGLAPHLQGSDAYRITLDYLRRAGAQAEPGPIPSPALTSIWAVTADQAAALDGCIPTGKGGGIVWVTRGTGPYLSLGSHAWSSTAVGFDVCNAPGTSGTIVIDDVTGAILGVYPYAGPSYPHPSPRVTLAPAGASPLLPGSSSPRTSPSGSSPSGSPPSGSQPAGSPSARPGASGSPRPSASGG
jgi:hypothetical protein